ncbi:MAG TPA: hypothetical protein VGK85_04540 [Myxococcaceae bacterium]|jgi:hypothetical protein
MATDAHDIQSPPGEPGPVETGPDGISGVPLKAVTLLWHRLVGLRWRTLAVVAPGNGVRAWRLAQALVEVATDRPRHLKAVNALDASVDRVAAVAHGLSPEKLQATNDRTRFIVAADSPLESPATIGLLSRCDAVLLLLERQRTRIPDGRRILELVGRERFIGAVLCPE